MSLPAAVRTSSRRVISASCVASSSRHTLPPTRSFQSTPTAHVREEFPLPPSIAPIPAAPVRRISQTEFPEYDGYTTNDPVPRPRVPAKATAAMFLPPPPPTPHQIAQRILNRLPEFAASKRFRDQVSDYGVTRNEQEHSIRVWAKGIDGLFAPCRNDTQAKEAFAKGGFQLDRLMQSFWSAEEQQGASTQQAIEHALTRNYVQFASKHASIPPARRQHLEAILSLTDLTNIAFSSTFLSARSIRRHFHLHIGPTNSGKTYNALKALAGAKSGAYAGPLRLLAHEVWERLNLGTVGGLDGESKKCHLLTGEEHRVVDPDSQLLSCTVEMLPVTSQGGDDYDVVVIDEIQMLKDSDRGGAWSKALLGVKAKEIHLCGDETMLNLLSNLIPTLGDTMEVHRYDRLTPLTVANESLKGDFGNVQKGDCVVTFSRNNIYAVKKQIEQITSRKCAVVYGALPPETRAEQARNFNDENSHEEILVASDAVGMGLNLKIKRLVFESLTKWNGKAERPLSLTQIKQIAGRAGRYGMSEPSDSSIFDTNSETNEFIGIDDKPNEGGVVTTLHEADLPFLRELLPIPLQPAKQIVIDVPNEIVSQMATLLPPNTKFSDIMGHISSLTVVPPHMTTGSDKGNSGPLEVIDHYSRHMSMGEMQVFSNAPINLRDPTLKYIFSEVLAAYTTDGLVDLEMVLKKSRYLSILDLCEATLAILPPLPPVIGIGRRVLTPPLIIASVPSLEGLHKALVLYMWLSFRLPIAFPDRVKAGELKQRCEVVLEDCIERLPGVRNKKTYERTKEGDGKVAVWRKKYVAPNGTRKFEGSDKKGVLWVHEAIIQRLRNKKVWASTGVVPQDKWLNEVDGKGPDQPAPPPAIPGGFRSNYLVRTPRARHKEDFRAHSGWYPAADPGREHLR